MTPALRGVVLWARTRHIPASIVAVVILTIATAAGAHALGAVHGLDQSESRAPLAFWFPVVLALAWTPGLTSPTALVDETCARPARHLRLWHLTIALVVGVAATVIALPGDSTTYGWAASARTYVGCLGLSALAARWLPDALLWVPATAVGLGWGLASSPLLPTPLQTVLFWPKQPGGFVTAAGKPDLSWWLALAVFAAGIVAASRPRRA